MGVKQNTKGKWVEEGLDFDIGIMKLQRNQFLFMTKLLESFINLVQFSK
jgi:hypothetical protein